MTSTPMLSPKHPDPAATGVDLVVRPATRALAGKIAIIMASSWAPVLGSRRAMMLGVNGKKVTVDVIFQPGFPGDGVMLPAALRRSLGFTTWEIIRVDPAPCSGPGDGGAVAVSRVIIEPVGAGGAVPLSRDEVIAAFRHGCKGGRVVLGGETIRIERRGMPWVEVLAWTPAGVPCIVGEATTVSVLDTGAVRLRALERVGGMDHVISELRSLVEVPLKNPGLIVHYATTPVRGVLLTGLPGVGKSMVARALAEDLGVALVEVRASDVVSGVLGGSEQAAREIFDNARDVAPCIVLIEEVDALAGTREGRSRNDSECRMLAELLAGWDAIGFDRVVVIGTTNRPGDIDPAFRRPGRFEVEIPVPVPGEPARREVFELHLRDMPVVTDAHAHREACKAAGFDSGPCGAVDTAALAVLSAGFTGADIAGAVRRAVRLNMARHAALLRGPDGDGVVSPASFELLRLSQDDLVAAIAGTVPSVLREHHEAIPDVTWDDIGGLDHVKQELASIITCTIASRDRARRLGVRLPRGVLLWGAPGNGKTLLAKAAANAGGCNFVSVSCSNIVTKWFGESERKVAALFAKARAARPCILFFDEFDAIAPVRDGSSSHGGLMAGIVAQLLVEMDGMADNDGILIMAATNRRDMIDPALLRKGRFDREVHVPVPDEVARRAIVLACTRRVAIDPGIDMHALANKIAARTRGFTGAAIMAIIADAGLIALVAGRDCIVASDIDTSIAAAVEDDPGRVTASGTTGGPPFYQ